MQFDALSFLAGAVIVGALVALVMQKTKQAAAEQLRREKSDAMNQLQNEITFLQGQVQEAGRQRADLENQLRQKQDSLMAAREELATVQQELKNLQQRFEEQKAFLEQAQQQMKDAFAALAAETLSQAANTFRDQAKETVSNLFQSADHNLAEHHRAIGELLKPLSEAIEAYKKEVDEMDKARRQAEAGLREALDRVSRAEADLQRETEKLRRALSTPGVRGRWGEIQLRRLVEMAGMADHCDFDVQVQVQTDDGRVRPDLIIHFPGDPPRKIPVDAKVPLDDFFRAVNAETDEERTKALKAHADTVRKHIDSLASKDYQQALGHTFDFVVMYLPLEPLFVAAAQADPALAEYAMQKRVLLTTPFTLLALLNAAATAWKQQTILENAEHIAEASRELYGRLCTFAEHLARIGNGLRNACDAFNDAIGSWTRRVAPAGQKVLQLGGASTDKRLPELKEVDVPLRELPEQARETVGTTDDTCPGELLAEEARSEEPSPLDALADATDESASETQ